MRRAGWPPGKLFSRERKKKKAPLAQKCNYKAEENWLPFSFCFLVLFASREVAPSLRAFCTCFRLSVCRFFQKQVSFVTT